MYILSIYIYVLIFVYTYLYVCACIAESRALIEGPPEVHIQSGSNINLTCLVMGSPEAPSHMHWFSGNDLINFR